MALTAVFVRRIIEGRGDPGKYFDGGGLLLRVRPNGTASWVYRWERDRQRREMGLGPVDAVALAKARELADNARRIVAAGGDPLQDKQATRAAAASSVSFDAAAERYISAHEASWKNTKHRAQWRSSLLAYASPVIGCKAVGAITTDDVLAILQPIWTKTPETASRVRGRIEIILDWARTKNLRGGENVARWRGHLALMLPPVRRLKQTKHHAAVPVDDLPAVYKKLGELRSVAAAATRFCLLCASRPGEVAGATWDEIDEESATWVIPGARMKAGVEHRVPLSSEALKILSQMKTLRRDGAEGLVFPGARRNSALSLTSLSMALRAAGGGAATVHGSARSSFDDWATERTAHSSKAVDRALAHGESDATRAAYRRSDLLEQRRALMADWAAFLHN